MSNIKVSALNMVVGRGRDANLPTILEAVRQARDDGSDVLVLPEMCLQGYADFAFPEDSPKRSEQKLFFGEQAETIPGPTTELVQGALAGSKMLVQLGMAESTLHGNVIYNSVALITADGVVGRYRKSHNLAEYPYFNQGEELSVVESPVGLVGSLICYDVCFPEAVRALAVQGADLILMSTAWPMQGHDRAGDFYGARMDMCIRANAFFNQVWIVASNHCEKNVYTGGLDYFGGSQIVGPRGEPVVLMEDDPGLVSHRADFHYEVRRSRAQDFFGLNLLQDHRPELYARAAG